MVTGVHLLQVLTCYRCSFLQVLSFTGAHLLQVLSQFLIGNAKGTSNELSTSNIIKVVFCSFYATLYMD